MRDDMNLKEHLKQNHGRMLAACIFLLISLKLFFRTYFVKIFTSFKLNVI